MKSSTPIRNFSARLEEQDGHLAQVEVNEMLCLVGDVAAKVPPDDAVPGGIIFLVKFLKKIKRQQSVNSRTQYPETKLEFTSPALHTKNKAESINEDTFNFYFQYQTSKRFITKFIDD